MILYEIWYIKIFRILDIPDIFAGTDGSGISNFTIIYYIMKKYTVTVKSQIKRQRLSYMKQRQNALYNLLLLEAEFT